MVNNSILFYNTRLGVFLCPASIVIYLNIKILIDEFYKIYHNRCMSNGRINPENWYGIEDYKLESTEQPLYLDGVQVGTAKLNLKSDKAVGLFIEFLGLDPNEKLGSEYGNCRTYTEFFAALFQEIEDTFNSETAPQNVLINAQNLKTQICFLLGEENSKVSVFDRPRLLKEWIIGFFHSLYLFLSELSTNHYSRSSILFPQLDFNSHLEESRHFYSGDFKEQRVKDLVCNLIEKTAENSSFFERTKIHSNHILSPKNNGNLGFKNFIIEDDILNKIFSKEEHNSN